MNWLYPAFWLFCFFYLKSMHILPTRHLCFIFTLWSHIPSNLSSCINLVITKNELKPQFVKLTQLWPSTVYELCQKAFLVLSGRLIIKLTKICFLCTHIQTKWIYSRDFMFSSNFSFTIFSLILFPFFFKRFH